MLKIFEGTEDGITGQKKKKVVKQLRQKSGPSKLAQGLIKNEGRMFLAQINLC